jgi:hypothetical protein
MCPLYRTMRKIPLTTRRTLVFDSSPTSGATRVLAGKIIPSSVEAQRSYYSAAQQMPSSLPSISTIVGQARDATGHVQQALNVAKSAAVDTLSPQLRMVASVRPAQNAIQRLLAQTPDTATRLPSAVTSQSAANVANIASQMVGDRVGDLPATIAAGIQRAKTPALIALGAAAVAGIAYAGYRFYKWVTKKKEAPTPLASETPAPTAPVNADVPPPEPEVTPITYQDLHRIATETANEYAKNKGIHAPPAGKILQLTQGLQAILETSTDPGNFVEKAINYVNSELGSGSAS